MTYSPGKAVVHLFFLLLMSSGVTKSSTHASSVFSVRLLCSCSGKLFELLFSISNRECVNLLVFEGLLIFSFDDPFCDLSIESWISLLTEERVCFRELAQEFESLASAEKHLSLGRCVRPSDEK